MSRHSAERRFLDLVESATAQIRRDKQLHPERRLRDYPDLSSLFPLLRADVRQAVQDKGGPAAVQRELNWLRDAGRAYAAAAASFPPQTWGDWLVELRDHDGWDEVRSHRGGLLLMQPHIGDAHFTQVWLAAAGMHVAAPFVTEFGNPRQDGVRQAVEAVTMLRRGSAVLFQPDAWFGDPPTAAQVPTELLGVPFGASRFPLIAERMVRNLMVAQVVCRLERQPPFYRLTVRRLKLVGSEGDDGRLSEVLLNVEAAILENVDQWRSWRFFPSGAVD